MYKKGYNKNTISHVIEKMEEYKYLDDDAYAKQFVLTYSKKYGKLKLISALLAAVMLISAFTACAEKNTEKTKIIKIILRKCIDKSKQIKYNRTAIENPTKNYFEVKS